MVAVPKTAKKPADHAAKAEAKGNDMHVEYSGVEYVLERKVIDDVNLIEMIGDMADNSIYLPKVVRKMLGPDQWAKFKTSNTDEDGRIPTECLSELFAALDDAAGKSSASPTS